MVQSAIVVDKKDNVGTALRCLEAGSSIRIEMASYGIDVPLKVDSEEQNGLSLFNCLLARMVPDSSASGF